MTVTQSQFTAAILNPAATVPAGLTDPSGAPAGRRFDVYRNNVVVGLSEALETAFPVLRKLLGDENFKGLSGLYVRKHPPSNPLIMHFGAELPAFLGGLPQIAHLPYLPDIARLELALREAYHAADADPIAPEALQAVPPADLMTLRVTFHPALRIVASPYPIHGIWARNMSPDAAKPQPVAETVMITRPAYDPVQTVLPDGAETLIAALADGAVLDAAIETAEQAAPQFDLTATLGALLSAGAIMKIETTP